jgi:hypothetical protein
VRLHNQSRRRSPSHETLEVERDAVEDELNNYPRQRGRSSMPYTIIHIDPFWRCPCGAPIKAFDIDVKPDEIVLDCRHCQRRLLAIEPDIASDKSAA